MPHPSKILDSLRESKRFIIECDQILENEINDSYLNGDFVERVHIRSTTDQTFKDDQAEDQPNAWDIRCAQDTDKEDAQIDELNA